MTRVPQSCRCDALIGLEEISRLVHEFTLDPDGFRESEQGRIRSEMLHHGITPQPDPPPRNLDSYLPQYRRYHEIYPQAGPVQFLLDRIGVTAAGVLQADEL